MRKTFFTLFLVLCTVLAYPQANQQSFKVVKGERPAIDLEKVPTDAYEAGKIKVKLAPGVDKSVPDVIYVSSSKGFVTTGVKSLDALNEEFGVKQYKPLLYDLYKSSKKSVDNKEKHKAWGFNRWFELELSSKANIKDVIKKYMSLKEVEFAEPVYKKVLIGNVPTGDKKENQSNNSKDSKWTPNDTRYSEQWHYNNTGQQSGTVDKDIDLPEAWDIEKGLNTVIVAVVDGGIQTNHPDLAANIWSGVGYNFVSGSSTLVAHDHGTHVAGTVAAVNANGTGVSGIAGGSGSGDGVRLMSCQVFTSSSSGGFDQAPIYAADNGASISQNSWGYTSVNVYDQTTLDAIDYFNTNGGGSALQGGITIFAAGNSNATGNWYPGCYSGTFSVAATNNNDVRSNYSNYGDWVDISAPGGEQTYSNDPKGVLSTLTGSSYGFYQGTSMACPHVSGVAALLISNAVRNNLVLTKEQLRDLLYNNVDNHYSLNSGYVGKLGSGRLNANLALQALQGMFSTTPPSTPTGLATANITHNSATLSWNIATGATSYDVQIRFQGGTYTTYSVTTNSYSATGLTANTTYEWSVSAKNSHGSSSYATTVTFTTQSTPVGIPLPVSESFATSTIPTGWTTQNIGTSITERWSVSNTANAGGSAYEMKCNYQNVNPGTTRLITPGVNTSGVSQVTFSFRHMLDAYGTGATLRVQTSNDKTNWTNTNWSVATSSTNISATTVNVTVTTNLNSTMTYFAFVLDGNLYQIDYWYVDNISITAGSDPTVPTVTTTAASAITTNSAISGGDVTDDGGATVTERGICYSTTANPTTANSKITSGTGTGTFTANMTGLTANTTYYVRAYAINTLGTAYGSEVSFKTLDTTTDITIGTGTSTQGYPINCYYGYERSASIYTATEVGKVGSISKVAWYPTLTTTYNVPIKIYIKHTTASTLTASTWTTLTSGATLVYSGTMAGTTANAWKEFVLSTAFNYTGGSNNLMVLVETNYGGTGAGSSTGAKVRYTSATSKHLYIRADNTAPTGNGTVSSYRPNIKLTIAASAQSQIDVNAEVESNIILSAYPNPTKDWITIKSNLDIKSIEIYSVTGAKVYSKPAVSNEINLTDFQSGVYIMVINDGIKRHTLRVVKQ